MNQRRAFLLTAGALATRAGAQPNPGGKVFRIGVLTFAASNSTSSRWTALVAELAKRGYVEGRNLAFEVRDARADAQRLDGLAVELVALQVDLIVTMAGRLGAVAAKKATTSIPIVMVGIGEPVRWGLVASLARPGGNVTGNASFGNDLFIKQVQLIVEAVGKPARVGVLAGTDYSDVIAPAVHKHRAQLHFAAWKSPEELDETLESMARHHVDALVIVNDPNPQRIAALTTRHRMPAIAASRSYAEAGLLLSYSVDHADLGRDAATYVDRIFKGAKPADLPVQQATKFEFVVNQRTAKTLGLTIPRSILLRADEVIQ